MLKIIRKIDANVRFSRTKHFFAFFFYRGGGGGEFTAANSLDFYTTSDHYRITREHSNRRIDIRLHQSEDTQLYLYTFREECELFNIV